MDAVQGVAEGVGPPDDVLGSGSDHERPRGYERADVRGAPAVVVDPHGAVAVAVGRAVGDEVLDASGLADRHDALDALVGRAEEP